MSAEQKEFTPPEQKPEAARLKHQFLSAAVETAGQALAELGRCINRLRNGDLDVYVGNIVAGFERAASYARYKAYSVEEGTKKLPGQFNCYANALDDEPIFVVLARDPSAPVAIEAWAKDWEAQIKEGVRPAADLAQVLEARALIEKMRVWRNEANGKWRLPQPSRPKTMG